MESYAFTQQTQDDYATTHLILELVDHIMAFLLTPLDVLFKDQQERKAFDKLDESEQDKLYRQKYNEFYIPLIKRLFDLAPVESNKVFTLAKEQYEAKRMSLNVSSKTYARVFRWLLDLEGQIKSTNEYFQSKQNTPIKQGNDKDKKNNHKKKHHKKSNDKQNKSQDIQKETAKRPSSYSPLLFQLTDISTLETVTNSLLLFLLNPIDFCFQTQDQIQLLLALSEEEQIQQCQTKLAEAQMHFITLLQQPTFHQYHNQLFQSIREKYLSYARTCKIPFNQQQIDFNWLETLKTELETQKNEMEEFVNSFFSSSEDNIPNDVNRDIPSLFH